MAALGRAVTDAGDWCAALPKPSWQPPDWPFGTVWTTIYALMVTAAVRDWRRAAPGGQRRSLVALFLVLRRRVVVSAARVAPYLASVSFASILNLTIVGLDAPFAPR